MSEMKRHLAEFEALVDEVETLRPLGKFADLEWESRRLIPFPLNVLALSVYHFAIEAKVCWWMWRRK